MSNQITPINIKTIHSKNSSLNTIETIVSLADYLGYTTLGIGITFKKLKKLKIFCMPYWAKFR